MKKITFLVLTLALMVGVFASTNLFNQVVKAAVDCTTSVVREADVTRQAENTPPTDNWVLYTRPATPGVGTFVEGPETPPLGNGSLELQTIGGSDKVFLFNFDHVGTQLNTINKMSYSTYRQAGSLQQVTALNMVVDENGPAQGGFTTLVFEPVYNTDQGPVVTGEWQDWDAFNGGNAIWWSTRPITGVCAFSCYVTWNQIVAANPEATISGGFGFNQGGGNPGLIANVDALTFGTTSKCVTYDLEPNVVDTDGDGVPDSDDACPNTPAGAAVTANGCPIAETKDQCKNGGWKTVYRADGSAFKNQGDCVSYTNNGK